MSKFSLAVLAASSFMLTSATPAWADDEEEALEPFRACGEIAAGPARLACFDAALAASAAAQQARRDRGRRRTQADFGLSSIQIEERYERSRERAQASGNPDEAAAAEALAPPEPTSVTSPLLEVLIDAGRRRVFILENGQMWREGNNSSLRGRIRDNSVATVSRGGVGGYRLRIEGRTGFISVTRIR
jgi:hypothetical protein